MSKDNTNIPAPTPENKDDSERDDVTACDNACQYLMPHQAEDKSDDSEENGEGKSKYLPAVALLRLFSIRFWSS